MDVISANWMNVVGLAVGLIALIVSFCSFLVSLKAFRLSQKQDARKRPVLVPSILNGYLQFSETEKSRVYAFLLSISNPSDSNNALARAELHITYNTPTQALVIAQIPSSPTRGEAYAEFRDFSVLSTPTRLDAHQTLTGWMIFQVAEAILSGAVVDGYTIALFDSHQTQTNVEPIMVQEYVSDVIPPLRKNSAPQ
jgi:hypothetical protein